MYRSINSIMSLKCNCSSIKSLLNNKLKFCFDNKVNKNFSNLSKSIFNIKFNSTKHSLFEKQNYNNISIYSLPYNQRVVYFSNTKIEQKVKPKTEKKSIENQLEILQKKRSFRKKVTAKKSEQLLPVVAFSTAEEYNLEYMSEAFNEHGLYQLIQLEDEVDEDVIHLCAKYEINQLKREFFIFREGSIVFWNMPSVECEAVLKFIKPFELSPYEEIIINEEKEEMDFDLIINSKTKLQKGSIFLNAKNDESSDLEKYAFSNAIALSVKLAIWESSLDRYVDSIGFVTQDMKEGKKIKLTRNQVFTKTGELFALKHRINLSSDLLDTPDFYWDRQELEKLFNDTYYHLNINKRTRVMNEKLSHCVELMELLSSHLNDIHHVRLEWMIIILIMVEVLFEFIHYAERLF